jgi:hypothetical protein
MKQTKSTRRASRSRFYVHTYPSPITQTTPFTHIPLIHDTFPIQFDKLAMDFGKANVFAFKNRITEGTSKSAGFMIDMAPKHRDTATNSFNGSANTGDVAEGQTTVLDLNLRSVTCAGRVLNRFLL